MPKVSILTPCYNVKEEWLSQCLESLMNQTLHDIELICIDDGSTDDTGKRLDGYAKRDARIKVFHKPNSGYGDSMNQGLLRCTGKYVGIVEPDDWVELEMFETLYKVAEENNLDLARCCHYEARLNQPEVAITDDWVPKNVVLNPLVDKSVFLQSPGICISLAKRQMLVDNNIRFLPTPGASFQDMSYGFKMKASTKRFMLIGQCFHHYRINEGSSVNHVCSEQKAFCVCPEWNEIFRFAVAHKDCFGALKADLPVIEKSCYVWNLDRLSGELRYKFVKKWQQELLSRIDEGEIDFSALLQGEREYFERVAYAADEWFDAHYPHERPLAARTFSGKISVVVTMYKNEDTIESTVKSVLTQNYKNLEIICVDDKSPDRCADIAQKMAKQDPRIRIIRRDLNGGLSAARNSGVAAATGEAVLFVDGDDELLPGAAKLLASEFEPDVDAVFSTCKMEYCGGESLYGHYPESDRVYYALPGDDVRSLSRHELFKYHCSAWAKLFRLKAIRDADLRFPEGLLFEDAYFTWSYFSLYNKRVAFVRQPVYLYRRRNGSIMSSLMEHPANKAIQDLEVLRRYYVFLREHGLLERFAPQLPALTECIFWFSFDQCAKWEKPVAVARAAMIMHSFGINRTTDAMRAIYDGNIAFLFPGASAAPVNTVVYKSDDRLTHRIVRAAVHLDEITRRVFPPGDTKIRRFAKRVWSIASFVVHLFTGKRR